ncbi:uroporphyrinogen decarboxylase/cobalamine-independent methonine synthase family protein [Neoasaia chiangmaiensis]|uniref:hypothetical protein n=1 Tax=Neoasaia chiangmaiensis TaxID=320497 RepID=UPI0020FFF5D0|nr:hypothetical protein [Neoasaia chiangmaiensis]
MKLLLTTYFGQFRENISLVANLPVAGVHFDAVNAHDEVAEVIRTSPADRVVSLGVIDGRNIWKTDLEKTLDWLEPVAKCLGDRLWIAPSLLFVACFRRSDGRREDGRGNTLLAGLRRPETLGNQGSGHRPASRAQRSCG